MTKQFDNVPPDKFSALRAALQRQGISVPDGNTGTIEDTQHGITLSFIYDGANVLSITVVKKPFFVLESMIWPKIQQGLDSV